MCTSFSQLHVPLSFPVNAKHRETKQHYTFYNTLDDTKRYMEKEDSLLNSIHDNFPRAMQSNGAKAQFLEQFQNIVSSITSNQTKLEERMEGEKITRDTLRWGGRRELQGGFARLGWVCGGGGKGGRSRL